LGSFWISPTNSPKFFPSSWLGPSDLNLWQETFQPTNRVVQRSQGSPYFLGAGGWGFLPFLLSSSAQCWRGPSLGPQVSLPSSR
jgi:hypothetical protein